MAKKNNPRRFDPVVPDDYARDYVPKYIALHLDKQPFFSADYPDSVVASLVRAAFHYAQTREVLPLDGIAKTFFDVLRADLDADIRRGAQLTYASDLRHNRLQDLGEYKGEGGSIEVGSMEEGNKEVGRMKEEDEGEKGRESDAPTQSNNSSFVAPSLDEVAAFFDANHLNGDAARFFFHYTANGWIIGKTKIKDWKAAARGWSKKEKDFASKPTATKKQDYRTELPFSNSDYQGTL